MLILIKKHQKHHTALCVYPMMEAERRGCWALGEEVCKLCMCDSGAAVFCSQQSNNNLYKSARILKFEVQTPKTLLLSMQYYKLHLLTN
jgi:hypothetical protein